MNTMTATYQDSSRAEAKKTISRLCQVLIGDWSDVSDRRSGDQMGIHITIKPHGNEVLGSIHVKSNNTWLRMKVTPGWFCAKGEVYERRDGVLSHVATVRLCHRKKERCILWQVMGADQSRCLPTETMLWRRR